MKSTKLVIALLLFATALTAHAAPLLNGLALEQQFNNDQYIAAVYSERLSDDANTLLDNNMPRSLQVRIVADRLSARRFRNQWMEGIAINNPSSILTGQADNMVTFANLFSGRLVAGDQLRVDFAAGSGTTTVSLNDVELGVIEDREFFNTLLRAWIGPVPPSTEFREQLLGAGRVGSGLLATYEALTPAANRVAQVARMVDQREAANEEDSSEPAAEPKPEKESVAAANQPKPDLKADIPAPSLAAIGTAGAIGTPAPSKPAPARAEPKPPAETESAVAVSKPQPLKPTTTRPNAPADRISEQAEEEDLLEEEEEAPLTADMILARQIYHSVLLRHTFKSLRYPQRAQERGQEGSIRLNVTIDPSGNVLDIATVQESRYSTLNREAAEAVRRAAPYPKKPPQLGKDEYEFTIPITFKLPD
ncbi:MULTISPECIES: TonB family protein [Microbulbifer]|uniref:TonB family protein n=1 Tax=Microbulbifer celer TaxID=435905 RepID=A0ABW3U2Z7_9GAMM|nr:MULTISPECIES: TonB family protein [Microbulbifer]UFN56197.1 TonB family protein [Microbulbifer celer]